MRFADVFATTQEDTRKVKTQTTRQTVEVKADGEGLVSHAGAYLLVELADQVGLTAALSATMSPTRERRSSLAVGLIVLMIAGTLARLGYPIIPQAPPVENVVPQPKKVAPKSKPVKSKAKKTQKPKKPAAKSK
jgi:hypothetical protein